MLRTVSVFAALVLLLTSLTGLWQGASFTADAASVPDVFHDQSSVFMSDIEPDAGDTLTVWLRAAKSAVSAAQLQLTDASTGEMTTVNMSIDSSHKDATGYYSFWRGSVTVPADAFNYRFYVKSGSSWYYYSQKPSRDVTSAPIQSSVPSASYGWYILPGFSTPDWAKGAVWYSLVPDAFFNGDVTNDDSADTTNYDQPWGLGHNGLQDRYGGDLQGIINKVSYLKELGVDAVFVNPISMSPQNAGYGSADLNQIESTFGNVNKFKELISVLHDNDLRIMQDVVVYFTPANSIYVNKSNNFWPNPGAFSGTNDAINPENPYYGFISDAGNGGFKCQFGGYVINNLNDVAKSIIYSTPEAFLQRYTNADMGFGVDGYRFDCGGWITGHEGLTDDYPYTDWENANGRHANLQTVPVMKAIRSAVKSINPDVVILSESSGKNQMNSGAWDAQWEMPSYSNQINGYVYQEKAPNGAASLADYRAALVNWVLWNRLRGTVECDHMQINTHDAAYCSFDSSNRYRLMTTKMIQMTFVGSPSIYYGEETNFSKSSSRDPETPTHMGFNSFDWNEENWDNRTMSFTKSLLELRKLYPALKTGAYIELNIGSDIYDFARFDESDAVFTISNGYSSTATRSICARSAGVAPGAVLTDWFTGKTYTVGADGYVTVSVNPGGTILVTGKKTSSYRGELGISSLDTERSESSSLLGTYVRLLVNGVDKSDEYNGSISVGSGGNAVLTGLDIDKDSYFTLSGDVTFDSHGTEKNNDSTIGIQIGTCYLGFDSSVKKNSGIYRIGGVIRPNLTESTGKQQTLTALTKGTGEANSVWLKVTSNLGPLETEGQITVNLKIEYNKGIIKFFVNGVNCSGDGIDYRAKTKANTGATVIDEKFSLGFFNDYFGEPFPFTLSNIKVTGDVGVSNTGVVSNTDGSIYIKWEGGGVGGTLDFCKFVNIPVYNAFTYTSSFTGLTGNGTIMARAALDNDSAYYAATVNGSTLRVHVRTSKGANAYDLTTAEYTGGRISIKRKSDNTFCVLVSGKELAGSAVTLGMPSKMYAGTTVTNGEGSFTTSSSKNGKVLFDDFNGSTVSSMFIGGSGTTPADGKLTVDAGTFLYSRTPNNDWTYKAHLGYTPSSANDWAGVIARQDDKSYVAAGRMLINGKVHIFLGSASNGKLTIAASVEDGNPGSDVVVQIQRIGTSFTAVYSYDGSIWYDFDGAFVFANYSDCYAGIAVAGSTSAEFDFVSFGDAIADTYSTSTPRTPSVPGLSFIRQTYTNSYRLQTISGNWTNASEGFLQTTETGDHQLGIPNVRYASFRIEATLKNETGSGSSGIAFDKKNFDDAFDSAYSLRYTSDKKLLFCHKSNLIATIDISGMPDELRVVADYKNGVFTVYAGDDATPVYTRTLKLTNDGFVSFYTSGVTARVMNFNVHNYGATLYSNNSSIESSPSYINLRSSSSAYASVRNTALSEYIITSNISITPRALNDGEEYVNYGAGLVLSSYLGSRYNRHNGVYLRLSYDGKLHLESNGRDVCIPYTVGEGATNVVVMVVKKGFNYSVYVNYEANPVLTYSDTYMRGGAITAVCSESSAVFVGLCTHELGSNEAAEDTTIFANWLNGSLGNEKDRKYSNDFSNSSTFEDFYSYDGAWTIEDGILKNTDKSSWDAGITYPDSIYGDAIFSFRMRNDTSSGYGGLGFRKFSQSGNHNKDGLSLFIYNNRAVFCEPDKTSSWGVTTISSANYTADTNWHDYSVVCIGSSIKLYRDGKFILECESEDYMRGFLSLRYAGGFVEYDDLLLAPIHEAELPSYSVKDEIAGALNYIVDGTDISASHLSGSDIGLASNAKLTVSGISNSADSTYAVTAKVTTSNVTDTGYYDISIGSAVINGRQSELVIRNYCPASDSIASYISIGYIPDGGSYTMLKDSVRWYTDTPGDLTVTVCYNGGSLKVFSGSTLILGEAINFADSGITEFIPGFGVITSGLTASVSDIKVYHGAVTHAENDVGHGFTIDGRRGSTVIVDNTTEYIYGIEYDTSLSISAVLNAVRTDSNSFESGIVLGSGIYNGERADIAATIAPNLDKIYIRIGDVIIESVDLNMKILRFGENEFDDSGDGSLPSPIMAPVTLFVSLNRHGFMKLSAECGTEESSISTLLAAKGITDIELAGGFISKHAASTITDWTVKGVRAEVDITHNTVITTDGAAELSISNSDADLSNIVYGNALRMRGVFTRSTVTDSAFEMGMIIGSAERDGVTADISVVAVPRSDRIRIKWGNEIIAETVLVMEHLRIGDNEFDDRDTSTGGTADAMIKPVTIEAYLKTNGTIEVIAVCADIAVTLAPNLTEEGLTSFKNKGSYIVHGASATVTDMRISGVGLYNMVTVSDSMKDQLKIVAYNERAGAAAVKVTPAEGSVLIAGSLVYFKPNGTMCNVIQRYGSSGETFMIFHDGDRVNVTAEFESSAITNFSQATLGTNLHKTNDTVNGVRFLTRVYMPHMNINPQKGDIAVNYGGSTYSVVDYGALIIPEAIRSAKKMQLTLDNAEALTAIRVSAKNGKIYYNCNDYIDFTVVIMIRETTLTGAERDAYYNKYYDREYALRSYLILRPAGVTDESQDFVVYGKQFNDTMRRSMDLSNCQ